MEFSTSIFLVVLVITLGATCYSIVDRVLDHREFMYGPQTDDEEPVDATGNEDLA